MGERECLAMAKDVISAPAHALDAGIERIPGTDERLETTASRDDLGRRLPQPLFQDQVPRQRSCKPGSVHRESWRARVHLGWIPPWQISHDVIKTSFLKALTSA
jgi:hypothetical protein